MHSIEEISDMPLEVWKGYRKTILNSYPDYNFEVRLEMMKNFNRIAKEENVGLYLSGGALLGAVRDNDFISWDGDVDFDALVEELEPKIENIKGKLIDCGYVTRVIRQYPKLKINSFYMGEKVGVLGMYLNDSSSHRFRSAYEWPKEIYDDSEEINFKGEIFKTPNKMEYISHTYGEDWKKPKKHNFFTRGVFRK
jgi:phosphorylcholine metabolism protein LicD